VAFILSDFPDKVPELKNDFIERLEKAQTPEELHSIRVGFLGKKGKVTQLLKSIGGLPETMRPEAGQRLNVLRREMEALLEERKTSLEAETFLKKERQEKIDVTLPSRWRPWGGCHPVEQVTHEAVEIFASLGFTVAFGPEMENDYYNFEALNIPKDHPARDMQDTFYIEDDIVLRTHTSPVQVRIREKQKPPVRIISPGKVYRPDSDVSHTPMFHQIEGLLVDKGITFGDLKGVLTYFVHQVFDKDTDIRFRPSFFPFTEPSAEVDIQCVMCRGEGCRVCSQTGWLEILGSGMVDPEVFKVVGYDPEVFSGFAFGLGVERIAMLKYGISDIRLFYENDQRFLKQF